jgi:hypothetical protein
MCQNLIGKFEANPQCYEQIDITNEKWHKKFTQINFNDNQEFQNENEILQKLFLEAIYAYKKENEITNEQFPSKFILEPIRMKRYMPNSEDRFDEHVDVTDLDSSRRFLVMFIYLNDNFEGGETIFNQLKKAVKPTEGNMLLFPPMWNWLHTANKVKGDNAKYIVGTYMHYV